jgi:group I intron endonuclease
MSEKFFDKSGIYAFRNKENGRVYVGQSKRVLTRKKQHERGDTNNSRRFHNAMNKHGADGFDFTVLEYCEIELLDKNESYWIEKLNSLYPNGYNLTSGGGAFQKHNPDTIKKMSVFWKKKYAEGNHLFATPEFQKKNSLRQKEELKLGIHVTQRPEFKEKRNKTVQERIAETGAFFKHSPETIALYKKQQQKLYAQGKGKFQDPELIEHNRQLVKQKLAEGKHHSQEAGWSEKARNAAKPQMKKVFVAIRTNDGQTIERNYQSIHEASRELNARRKSISQMSTPNSKVLTTECNLGKVIRVSTDGKSNWKLSELKKIPDSALTKSIKVKFTIEKEDGKLIRKTYDSMNQGCIELDAQNSAVKWIRRSQKYKSTKCNLGRIIKVEDV